MVTTENLLCRKKCNLVKQRRKTWSRIAWGKSRANVSSVKSDRMKAAVKADKRGTMMMAIIFGLFFLESRVARVLNIYRPDYFIVEKSCVRNTYLQSFWALSQIFLEKFRTQSF